MTTPDTHDVDAVVIGAGVVGLAISRALARAGREVTILERNEGFGQETSSRNSEVIHAGIVYAAGSLKARLCVAGKAQLYAFCAARGVPHRRTGKIIVATDPSQTGQLERVLDCAAAAGVTDLRPLDRAMLSELEPHLRGVAGLLSPSTGIVDGHALMLALLGEAENHGAQLVCRAEVTGGQVLPDGRIALRVGPDTVLRARSVVNVAGLWAQAVAAAIEGLRAETIPPLRLAKGSYFVLQGRAPFAHLIYPAPPGDGSLGVHLTLDLAGGARFGPDIEHLDHARPDAVDYTVDPARAAQFEAAVRSWWPDLPDGSLVPGYAGCRPKLAQGDAGQVDFRIDGPERHGLDGHVMCYGLESPALTASFAIAETVCARLHPDARAAAGP